MRGVETHLQAVLDGIEPLEPLGIAVSEVVGAILAEDAIAPLNLPFDGITEGEVVLAAGTTVGPRQTALLAGAGLGTVQVRPRPRVVVMSVGSRLVAPGRVVPTAEHSVDAVQDMLAGAVLEAGGVAYHVGPLMEDPTSIAAIIEDQLVRADLVVIASGNDDKPAQAVLDAIPDIGQIEISDVAINPGMWQCIGKVGADDTPLVLVSGEPETAFVSFEIFIRPILRRMLGQDRVLRPVVRAKAAHNFVSVPGRQDIILAKLSVVDGKYVVTPTPGKGLKALGSDADCLIVVPEDVITVNEGDSLPVLRLDRP